VDKIKLFCFPYAGGSARFYKSWQKYFPPEIEVIPIDPPGRGKRFGVNFCESVEGMVQDMFGQIKDQITDGRYAIFGHSMGGVVAQEITYVIRKAGLPLPMHLFLSGRGCPHIPDEDDEKIHLLPDAEFKAKLIDYGGTPEEVLANDELMNIFLPILRADFRVCDNYEHEEQGWLFPFGVTVLVGMEEKLTEEQIQGWQLYSAEPIKVNRFPGGHFFLHQHELNIVRIISHTLFRLMEGEMGDAIYG
jgi:surfactin synthase thioesterase subunit